MKRSAIIFLHAGYWILYLLLLSIFVLFLEAGGVKIVSQTHEKMLGFIKVMCSMTLLPTLTAFYIFYSFLFDRFLSKKKIVALCIAAVITILLSSLIGILGLSVLLQGKIGINSEVKVVLTMLLFMSVLSLIHGTIALVMKGFITWYGDIKIKEELQRKNFETELALVKSQLNPHFLFNTINNIDVLIEKDATKASAYLNKLSDIMRFMLYETKTENIPLQKELTYIEKYIDLQKIRTANANFVQYAAEGNSDKWMIAPMLFIPFIENAFKHSLFRETEKAWIHIDISLRDDNLCMKVANSYHPVKDLDKLPGIGLANVRKRLELSYPGRHQLDIRPGNDIFEVHLKLSLHAKDPLRNSR